MFGDNILKKLGLIYAELVSMGAEKVKEVADDFVKKGILHDEDAQKFVSEVKEKLQAKEAELQQKSNKLMSLLKEAATEIGIPIKSEEEKLDNKIAELEKTLEELKAKRDALRNKE